MGLFDEQVGRFREILSSWRAAGAARDLSRAERREWPEGASLVLEEDTAFEMGNPALASEFLLLMCSADLVDAGAVTVVGPDIPELRERSVPYGQVVLVGGSFDDEYDSYRDIRDTVYETKLEGISVRTMPSRSSIWVRVSREAAGRGVSLADLGFALVGELSALENVEAVEAVFVTAGIEDVRRIAPLAADARRVVDALMKMYQEKNFDCETCEYRDVCDTVMDLKKIRKKLEDQKTGEK